MKNEGSGECIRAIRMMTHWVRPSSCSSSWP